MTKNLSIITLTRIFTLTQDYPSLVREITTPSLTSFITLCLNLTSVKSAQQDVSGLVAESACIDNVLQSFKYLIRLHPSSFRPYSPQIQALITSRVAPTPSNIESTGVNNVTPEPVRNHARQLLVLLHVCALKNTTGEVWAKSLRDVLASIHRTADLIFRVLVEDWTPDARTSSSNILPARVSGEVLGDPTPAPLHLPGWIGIHAGLERLDGLLNTLKVFLSTATSAPVTVPVSEILETLDRILSALVPTKERSGRTRPEIGRDEREALFSGLPMLHVSAMYVLSIIITRFGLNLSSVIPNSIEQILWVFDHEQTNSDVRGASYSFIAQAMTLMGQSMPKQLSEGLSHVIQSCCEDLLPSSISKDRISTYAFLGKLQATDGKSSSTSADAFPNPVQRMVRIPVVPPAVQAAASRLLLSTLKDFPCDSLTVQLRTQLDRTAILIAHMKAMLASAMNFSAKQQIGGSVCSILPLLARRYSDALEVEALIRPQMPVLQHEITSGDGISNEMGDGVGLHVGNFWPPHLDSQEDKIEKTSEISRQDVGKHLDMREPQGNGMHINSQDLQPDDMTEKPHHSHNQLKTNAVAAIQHPPRKRDREPSFSTHHATSLTAGHTARVEKKPRSELDDKTHEDREDDRLLHDEAIAVKDQGYIVQTENANVSAETIPSLDHASIIPDWSAPAALPMDLSSDESDFEIPRLETGNDLDMYLESEEDEDEDEEANS